VKVLLTCINLCIYSGYSCIYASLSLLDEVIHNAGDIESMPFIEALGQFSYRVGELFALLHALPLFKGQLPSLCIRL